VNTTALERLKAAIVAAGDHPQALTTTKAGDVVFVLSTIPPEKLAAPLSASPDGSVTFIPADLLRGAKGVKADVTIHQYARQLELALTLVDTPAPAPTPSVSEA
jgi:hypothetical protein